jgi:hypothetical protein
MPPSTPPRREALPGQHGADLATGQAQVAEHAELPPPGRRQGGKAGRHAGQADGHRHRLEQIGDGEGAVEDAQADGADLAGPGDLQRAGAGQPARASATSSAGARGDARPVVGQPVAGESPVVGQIDHHGAGLARVVTPHAGHRHRHARPARGSHLLAGLPAWRSCSASEIQMRGSVPAAPARATRGRSLPSAATGRAIRATGGCPGEA